MGTVRASMGELAGKRASLVRKDRTVLLATLVGLEGDFLLVANMRRQKQKIALNSLAEIIFDLKAGE